MIALVVLISVLSLGVAVRLARGVLTADDGTPAMQAIADTIEMLSTITLVMAPLFM
jgi:Na+/H+-translocating membrane pyrophosphatase